MDLRIREATEDDAAALRAYLEKMLAEDLPGMFRRSVPTLEEERDFIRSFVTSPNGTLLIAEVDGSPVGLTHLIGESRFEEAHVGTFGLSVDADWRGRGIGSDLIEALAEWALAHGVTRIQGNVFATNPRALELYERHGFVREGIARRALIRDGKPIDQILIARLLDE